MVLSPFTVSTTQDQGYDTQETLSGTRLKTPNKFVGAAISEVNQQFMQDLAIFSVKEVIDYTANAVAYDNGRMGDASDQNQNASITASNQFTIRGGFTTSASRDFITSRVAADAYNIDRVSVNRGPNAILFGLGAPQGIVNVVPTHAEFKDSYQFGARIDNWGSMREHVRINRQLIKGRLAIFVAQVAENVKTNQKPSDKKRDRITGSVTVRPFRTTTIRGTFEHGHLNDLAVRPWPVQDGLSTWVAAGRNELPPELQNGGAQFASQNLTPALNAQKPALAARLATLGFQLPFRGAFAVPMKVFNSTGGGEAPWLNSNGYAVTRYNEGVGIGRAQNSTLLDSPIPYTANVPGYGQYLNINFNSQALMIEQAIGKDLFIQGIFNRQWSHFLTNNTTNVALTWLMMDKNPTVLTIDNQIIPNPNYDRYFTISGNPSVIHHRYFDEAKVGQAAYKFDFTEHGDSWFSRFLGRHNILGLTQQTKFRDSTNNEALTNATPFALRGITPQVAANTYTTVGGAGSSPLQILTYLDPKVSSSWALPDFYTKFGGYKSVYAGMPLPPADPSGITPFWRATSSTKALQTINSQVIVLQSYLWDERIVPTFGWRKDIAETRNITNAPASYNGLAGWLLDASPVDIYKGDAAHPVTYNKQVGRTKTMGVVVYPIRQLGLFFNQSTNYSSVGGAANVDQFGDRLPPSTAQGRDWGVKLPLFGGKVFATINRYTVKQSDVANSLLKNGFGGPFTPNGVLFRISADLYNLTGDSRFHDYPWISNVTNQTWSGTNDGWFKGYELSLTANPTKNWRISVSGARQFAAASNYGKVEQRWHDTQLAYLEQNHPGLLDAFTGSASVVDGRITTVRGQFADYQLAINQALTLAGRRNTRQPEWTGNLITAYDFISGPLKNFGIGGSFRYRSKTTIGYAFLPGSTSLYDADKPFSGPSRNPIGLFASYRFKLNRTRGTVQLNADSINFSEDLYPYFATDDGTGNPIVSRWAVGQGTTWALSVRFDH